MCQLRNHTNRELVFVHKENLTPRGNGRFEIEDIANLSERERLPVSGFPLRVYVRIETVQHSFGIPVFQEVMTGADPIPEGDDILIVSKQYAEACRRLCRPTHRLRVVCGGVYTLGLPFPVASTGLSMVEACLPYSSPGLFDQSSGVSDAEGAIAHIREARLNPPAKLIHVYPVVEKLLEETDMFPDTLNY